MTDKIKSKVLEIVELAMLLNPTRTQRGVTGDKPTVFVGFSGHCCDLDVQIHLNGWDWREPYCREDIYKNIDFSDEKQEKKIDEAIDILQKLYNEWEEK